METKRAPAVASGKPIVTPPPVVVTPPPAPEISEDDHGSARADSRQARRGPRVPVTVADAMPFSIKLAEDVPVDAEEGRVLRFTAVDGLKIGDAVVIAKGASVIGSIVERGKEESFRDGREDHASGCTGGRGGRQENQDPRGTVAR